MFVKKEGIILGCCLTVQSAILMRGQKLGQTIIFVSIRHSASMLHKTLSQFGYEVTTIQGALKQKDGDKMVKEFKDGWTQVNLVVNYDLPVKHDKPMELDCKVYLHRVGRAGRIGCKGAAFNLVSDYRDVTVMQKLERHCGKSIAEPCRILSFSNGEESKVFL
ncbi:hypothetical protein RJ641_000930, partial [Dillenia turbinata]